jgi:hypothetical protein
MDFRRLLEFCAARGRRGGAGGERQEEKKGPPPLISYRTDDILKTGLPQYRLIPAVTGA